MHRFSLKWQRNLAKWQGFGRALTGQNSEMRQWCGASCFESRFIGDAPPTISCVSPGF